MQTSRSIEERLNAWYETANGSLPVNKHYVWYIYLLLPRVSINVIDRRLMLSSMVIFMLTNVVL
ncbi:hypothetical protein [Paenibacillus taichungensis]|uniref:hypothetical protein n=1 Tax=Paenibacillus taichungensis TaxID=484184 RepID=UPI0015C5DB65|nr:hypothetical protein [Paenibacillus taichungensis]